MNCIRRCRYGLMSYNLQDIWIGRSFENYGENAESEIALLHNIIKEGNVVLDVGASIGSHAIPFSRCVGSTGKVLAFEPERRNFYQLCANIAINEIRNVFPFQQAVGRTSGVINVPELNDDVTQNFSGLELWRDYDGATTYPVALIKIDDLGLTQCDFIKVDVEGMEADVLGGAKETITRFRPHLYVEKDNRQGDEITSILEELNYKSYVHNALLYNPSNFYGNPDNCFISPENIPYIAEMIYAHHIESPPAIHIDHSKDSNINSKCSIPIGSKGTTTCAMMYRQEKGDFDNYLHGDGIDIGGGYDALKIPNGTCAVWDIQEGDATYLSTIPDNHYDFAYSSHCLEHIEHVHIALLNWCRIIKPNGILFICVPDWELYEKSIWPSRFNSDHKHTFSINHKKSDVKRRNHWNVTEDIAPILASRGIELIEIRLENHRYDSSLPMAIDQTAAPYDALAQICIIGRKRS